MRKYIITLAALYLAGTGAAQKTGYSLRDCLNIGLEQNYAVQIVRNEQEITDQNVTLANAGYIPTVGLTGGYTGRLENTRTTGRDGAVAVDNGAWNQTANANLGVTWNLFDGFRVQTNYDRLKELQAMGEVNTRVTIEDFVASLTAEYYNYIQQQTRLKNYAYAVSLSKERLRIVEARHQIGNFSRLDLLQARVDFNADSSKLMTQQELVYTSRVRMNEIMANADLNASLPVYDPRIVIDDALDWESLQRQT